MRKGSKYNPETGKYEMPEESPGSPLLTRNYPKLDEKEIPSAEPIVIRTPPESSEQGERDEKKIKGMRLRLTDAGGVDWKGHEESGNKEKLESILKADEHTRLLYVTASQYTPESAGMLLNTFANLEALAMKLVFKFDADVASKAFSFNEEQHKMLDPVTARLMNKWMPDYMVKWQDEIMFCSLMIVITRQQIEVANVMQKAKINEFMARQAGRVEQQPPAQNPVPLVMTAEGEA
jgi:hypothetical protein